MKLIAGKFLFILLFVVCSVASDASKAYTTPFHFNDEQLSSIPNHQLNAKDEFLPIDLEEIEDELQSYDDSKNKAAKKSPTSSFGGILQSAFPAIANTEKQTHYFLPTHFDDFYPQNLYIYYCVFRI